MAKLIGFALFCVGFVIVICDAKAVEKLPNGGAILSPDGKYIPGRF